MSTRISPAARCRPLRRLLASVLLVGAQLAGAQVVQQVADLQTGIGLERSSIDSIGTMPNGSLGGFTYFAVRDRDHGGELWVTDGTAANAHLFADLCPGLCGSDPNAFFLDGSRLYFTASDGRHGRELWSLKNGDSAPTMIGDLDPGAGDSSPGNFRQSTVRVGNTIAQRIYFSARDPAHGRELWSIVPGAAPSARLEADINPGPADSDPLVIGPTDAGFKQLVLANNGSIGREAQLIGYDSLSALPTSVAPLADLTANGSVFSGSVLGANTWLALQNFSQSGDARIEVWITQGTAATTIKLLALSDVREFVANVSMNRMFFAGKTAATGLEPFISDGTVAGTQRVKDVAAGAVNGVQGPLVALGSAIVFIGNDGSSGAELWRSDGTAAGTTLLKDVVVGSSGMSGGIRGIELITAANRLAVYFANAGTLWRSDGTTAGTTVVRSLSGSTPISQLTPAAGANVIFSRAIAGDEPHFSDGTNVGTVLLGNFNDGIGNADPGQFAPIGERLSFFASGDAAVAMYSTTGSGASIYSETLLDNAGYLGDRLLQADSNHLLSTDGTTAGTTDLAALQLRSASDSPPFRCSAELDGALYFIAQEPGSSDRELFRSDGTLAGTHAVTDLTGTGNQGYVDECYYFMANVLGVGGRMMFVGAADYNATGRELMRSDGVNPAQLVADIDPGTASSDPQEFTRLGNRMLFTAASATTGRELWISDGTAQGTKLLKDVEPGPVGSDPQGLVQAGGLVYFHAYTVATGRELWVSDGTTAGTHLVADLYVGPGGAFRNDYSPSSQPKAQGRRVWFTATGSSTPCALYSSDGSAAGTRCEVDPIEGFVRTDNLLPLPNGAVVFSAWRASDGEELRVWRGGRLLSLTNGDVRAGGASASPRGPIATPRGIVYFAADDGNSGRELWKLDLSDFIFADRME